jgi:transcriptional regulator with XRE-family HTH domain
MFNFDKMSIREGEIKVSFGYRLQQARKNKKLTQKEVADRLGIHNTTISKYENNESEPDNQTLMKLTDLYDVDATWLITGAVVKNDGESIYLANLTAKILSDVVNETGIDLSIPGNKELLIDLIRLLQNRNTSK